MWITYKLFNMDYYALHCIGGRALPIAGIDT
jgi:hypothetical protein